MFRSGEPSIFWHDIYSLDLVGELALRTAGIKGNGPVRDYAGYIAQVMRLVEVRLMLDTGPSVFITADHSLSRQLLLDIAGAVKEQGVCEMIRARMGEASTEWSTWQAER